jgi:hypothetical protein
MAETFEDLRVWQTARALTNAVYEHTKTGAFSKDFGLRDQIQRAAVSIMFNVAPQEYFLPPVGARKASKAEPGASSSTTPARLRPGEIRGSGEAPCLHLSKVYVILRARSNRRISSKRAETATEENDSRIRFRWIRRDPSTPLRSAQDDLFPVGASPRSTPTKASAGEVRCQLYVAKDQGYIDQDTFEELSDDAEKITRQLYRLIEHLENSSSQVSDIDKEYLASPK